MLLPPPVELEIEDLLPGAEVLLTFWCRLRLSPLMHILVLMFITFTRHSANQIAL